MTDEPPLPLPAPVRGGACPPSRLGVARLALWLGLIGFGGGYAVARQLRQALVARRRWVSEPDFAESLAVATSLPGPPGSNLLAILGARLCGAPCGALAAALFLLPSVVAMIAFGAVYDRLRGITTITVFLNGMSVATVGVIAAVAIDIGRSALVRRSDWALAAAAFLLLATRTLSLLEVITLTAMLGAFRTRPSDGDRSPRHLAVLALPALKIGAVLTIAGLFARIGLATFGGGFAMIPAIEHEVVTTREWLSEAAFQDAMVFGQVTPGPVAIAATFIGYRVAGLSGALSATVGMFGPPLLLSLAVQRSLGAFRKSPLVQGALRAVSTALVGILASASFTLFRASETGRLGAVLALVSALVLVVFRRVPPVAVLFASGTAYAASAYLR